jgi:beta-glucosidase
VAGAGAGDAVRQLRGFQRIHLRAGESRTVEFTLEPSALPKATAKISVGGGQPAAGVAHVEGTL